MLRILARGLLGRFLGYGVLALGFWLLFQGFLEDALARGIAGGLLIPAGMYLLVVSRRSDHPPEIDDSGSNEEDTQGDCRNGRRQGD